MRRFGKLSRSGVCGSIMLAVVIAVIGCGSEGGSGEFSQEFEKPDNLPKPKVKPIKPDRYSDMSPRQKRAMKKEG